MDAREQKLFEDFERLKPDLLSWASHVDTTLGNIIKAQYPESGFIQIGPQSRCKSTKSLLDKAFHRDKNYENPLLEIEDKVATRIVVVTTNDVYKVKAIVSSFSQWKYKVTKDIRETNENNPNLFDYQSVHVILWPAEAFGDTAPELLICELQVRTLLQHSYAEVTHDSVYKGPYKSDNAMKRSLAKCMALMETTDDMFCSIFNKISMNGTVTTVAKEYLVQLISLYNKILQRNVDYKDIDIEFTDNVFELLNKFPVSIEDLTEYCTDIKDVIQAGVASSSSTIFNQPAILLLFYYAEVDINFLKNNFSLNTTTLRQIMGAINVATDY